MAVLLTPTHPLRQFLRFGAKGNDVCSVSAYLWLYKNKSSTRGGTHITPQMPLNFIYLFIFLNTESCV